MFTLEHISKFELKLKTKQVILRVTSKHGKQGYLLQL